MVKLLDPTWPERASLSLNKQRRKEDPPPQTTPWVFPFQLSIFPCCGRRGKSGVRGGRCSGQGDRPWGTGPERVVRSTFPGTGCKSRASGFLGGALASSPSSPSPTTTKRCSWPPASCHTQGPCHLATGHVGGSTLECPGQGQSQLEQKAL